MQPTTTNPHWSQVTNPGKRSNDRMGNHMPTTNDDTHTTNLTLTAKNITEALTVSCPTCKAPTGEHCTRRLYGNGRLYHLSRADKAHRHRSTNQKMQPAPTTPPTQLRSP
jgi:hypothetical protein